MTREQLLVCFSSENMVCRKSLIVSLIALLAIENFLAQPILSSAPQQLLQSSNTSLGEVKYQVSLKRGLYNICGGALISELHVITAAHCFVGRVDPPYTKGLVIVTGTKSLKSGGEHHYAKFVTVHPKYVKGDSTNRWRHDIAVITLVTPAVKNAMQAPVSLPSNNITRSVKGLVSGWGQMQRGLNGQYPDDLKTSFVTILNQSDCNSRNTILDTQLCAFDGRDTGICEGDSGGPLVYNNEIVGIVSFSVSCGIGYPDIYTRVWSYKKFITEAMKRN